jgi:hypothetical protein
MTTKSVNRSVKSAGRQAASSRWLQWLARGGLMARVTRDPGEPEINR